jgi:hypothetical protein
MKVILEVSLIELEEIKWGEYPAYFEDTRFISLAQYGGGMQPLHEREQGALVKSIPGALPMEPTGIPGLYTSSVEIRARVYLAND